LDVRGETDSPPRGCCDCCGIATAPLMVIRLKDRKRCEPAEEKEVDEEGEAAAHFFSRNRSVHERARNSSREAEFAIASITPLSAC